RIDRRRVRAPRSPALRFGSSISLLDGSHSSYREMAVLLRRDAGRVDPPAPAPARGATKPPRSSRRSNRAPDDDSAWTAPCFGGELARAPSLGGSASAIPLRGTA